MESIAVYQLADRFNIPCISIKGISNSETLNESYNDDGLENLAEYVKRYLEKLKFTAICDII